MTCASCGFLFALSACSEVGQVLDQAMAESLGVPAGSFYTPDRTVPVSASSSQSNRPTVLSLVGAEYGEASVFLRWSGDRPSMRMTSGEWVAGNEVETNVFEFSEDKFYQLTIHFPHKAYIEGGFDGAWLPTRTGSYTVVR